MTKAMKTAAGACWGILILVGLIAGGGCESDFSNHYTRSAISPSVSLRPYSGSTRLIQSENIFKDGAQLSAEGFALLGFATFQSSGRVTIDQLRDQAREVGADVVLYSVTDLGAQQSYVPVFAQNAGTSVTNTFGPTDAAPAFNGSSGNVRASSSIPGSISTKLVPVTIEPKAYAANFFRKIDYK
jgi:hypothetical protein